MVGRKDFSWFNGMSVEHLFIAMKDECRCIEVDFRRSYLEIGLDRLIKEARKNPDFRNQAEIRKTWLLIQPDLREAGILKTFDTPAVKARIIGFIRGPSVPLILP